MGGVAVKWLTLSLVGDRVRCSGVLATALEDMLSMRESDVRESGKKLGLS